MGLIMTIACMNLATMLLARGANRRKELAIRLGVGASRFRLIRQMISESILLSLLGGVAGFALAYGLSVVEHEITAGRGGADCTRYRSGLARGYLRVRRRHCVRRRIKPGAGLASDQNGCGSGTETGLGASVAGSPTFWLA